MTLQDLVDRYRPQLADETVGVRRSWEEVFKYTFRHYPADTPLESFDLDELARRLTAANLHTPLVAGYVTRWRQMLERADAL